MKKIELTEGQYALVDDEDYFWLNEKYDWIARRDKSVVTKEKYYAMCELGYSKNKKKIVLSMARVIYEFHYRIPNGLFIDHINGNSLDNQKKNLRAVTPRQNAQNRFDSKSKYPGVMKCGKNKWTSKIKIGKKYKNLGVYDSELKAFNAYEREVESLGEKVIKKGRNEQRKIK